MTASRLTLALLAAALPAVASAQPGYVGTPGRNRVPAFDANMRTGELARLLTAVPQAGRAGWQAVEVSVPGGCSVAAFDFAGRPTAFANATGALLVGHTYRLRVADMPRFPGVELYPSVEVLDRLRPPAGAEWHFPAPIEIDQLEIEAILRGRMVTKVVHLEQPQLAVPADADELLPLTVDGVVDVLHEADLRGRPVLLVRIGGRTPDAGNPHDGFFLNGGPAISSPADAATVGNIGGDGRVRQTTFSPASPRCPPSHGPGSGPTADCPSCGPRYGVAVDGSLAGAGGTADPRMSDEYICDGGDRGVPAYGLDPTSALGLETEDAVARYTDAVGKTHAIPTNRVCVYAPRFGAVRTLSRPAGNSSITSLASADVTRTDGALRARANLAVNDKATRLADVRMRERAGGVDAGLGQAGVSGREGIAAATKLINAFEDLVFVSDGVFVSSEQAVVGQLQRYAIAWSRAQSPMVSAEAVGGQEVIALFRELVMVGVEDKSGPPQLRVVKMADVGVAAPGEEIAFTIRFDNTGGKPLTELSVVDNLTPRLELVPDSLAATVPGEFVVAPNGEGSSVITFLADGPLGPGEGGAVTFRAVVR